jgi:hypothetical protein
LRGRFGDLAVNNRRRANSALVNHDKGSPMSYRMKITLPDPTMAQLEALAEQRGEPASRIAAQMVCAGLAEGKDPSPR